MAKFRYVALSPNGAVVRGEIDAPSETDAEARLRERGITIRTLAARPGQRTILEALAGGGKPGLRDRIDFLRLLARLTSARLPLIDSVTILSEEAAHPRLRLAARDLLSKLESGSSLSQAWRETLPEFPGFVHHLLHAGEQSGDLGSVLQDAVEQLEFRRSVEADVRQAGAYPAFIIAFGLCVTFFVLAFVVPQFANLATRQGSDLPMMSALVFTTSALIASNLTLSVAGLAAILCAPLAGFLSPAVRRAAARAADRIKPVRALLQMFDIARWSGVVQLGLTHGVPLVDSLELGRESIASPAMSRRLEQVQSEIASGKTLHQTLADHTPLTSSDLGIVRACEASGEISAAFALLREEYQSAARSRIRTLTKLLEPASILVVAMFVGTIVVSLVLAMTSIYDFNASS